MAGIYIHIPFCLKKCSYCDFYRVTGNEYYPVFTDALLKEIGLRSNYLSGETVETIYFGGGTPSLLPSVYTGQIMEKLYSVFNISDNPEITIEANPDDITATWLNEMLSIGFNRMSIGVQSWTDKYLRMLGRRHDSKNAAAAVRLILEKGFNNLSLDLMYGLPGMTTDEWQKELDRTFEFDIKHLSAYHLTIEDGTPLFRLVKAGQLREADEEESNRQFLTLITMARAHGFIHYEISNFSREDFFSRHNRSYWQQISYIGLGPSAHSFNGYSRQWNVSDLIKYIKELKSGQLPYEIEELDFRTRYNEYIMTSLRTMWGIDLDYIEKVFNKESHDYTINLSGKLLSYGMLRREKNSLILTDQGVMIADNIISSFMMV